MRDKDEIATKFYDKRKFAKMLEVALNKLELYENTLVAIAHRGNTHSVRLAKDALMKAKKIDC